MDKQAYLIQRLESGIKSGQESIEKFAEKLVADPAYTLSWGNDSFKVAAMMMVQKQVLNALNDGATVQAVKDTLMDRVLNKSKYPAQSTSPTSNLIEQYELSAYAELLSDLRYYEGE